MLPRRRNPGRPRAAREFVAATGLFHPLFGIDIIVARSALGIGPKVVNLGIIPFGLLYLAALALIRPAPTPSGHPVRILMIVLLDAARFPALPSRAGGGNMHAAGPSPPE
jgi:hypothetical protein